MKKINDRHFVAKSCQLRNINGGYENHVVIQEVNATAFESQSLSNFSPEDLGILYNADCIAFPECGLPVLLMLKSQGKL